MTLHAVAGEAGLELLVVGEAAQVYAGLAVGEGDGGAVALAVRAGRIVARHGAGGEAGVVAPVEAQPHGFAERQVVLEVRRLVVLFVVVNAERAGSTRPHRGLRRHRPPAG